MGPKKKGGKKVQNDDWESELGEVPDPIAAAAAEAKSTEEEQKQESKERQTGRRLR